MTKAERLKYTDMTKKFTDKELLDVINSTDNLKLLELAEEEFIRRNVSDEPYLTDLAFGGYEEDL